MVWNFFHNIIYYKFIEFLECFLLKNHFWQSWFETFKLSHTMYYIAVHKWARKKNRFDSKRISPMHFYNCKILSNTISMTKRGLGWTICFKISFFLKLENADFHTPKSMTFNEFKTDLFFLQLTTFKLLENIKKVNYDMITEIKGSPFRVCVKICRFFSLIHMQLC